MDILTELERGLHNALSWLGPLNYSCDDVSNAVDLCDCCVLCENR